MLKNRKPKVFYGYWIVSATSLIMAASYGTIYTFAIFFKPLLAEFSWTRAMISGASSLSLVVSCFLALVSGRLSDRFGPRIVVTACGFFLGLGYLLLSQTNTIWQLYLFYGVIVGIALSGFWAPLLSTVARWFVKRRGMMTGIVVSGVGVGMTILPLLTARLISSYGWRTSYIILGTIASVLIVLAAQFLRRDPSQMGRLPYGVSEIETGSSDLQARGFSLREAIHTRQFWLLCTIFSSLWFSTSAITVHIVIHSIDLGIPAISAANIPAIMGGGSIIGRMLLSSATDRIGYKPAFIIGLILMSASLLWLLVAKELWMFYLFAVIFGFAYGGVIASEAPGVAALFGLTSLGTMLGSIELVSVVFSAIGPIIAGLIFDTTSSYQPAFLIYIAVSMIAVISAIFLRPTSNKGGTK